ncbi:hypothetical protein BG74_02705 [Sodalis-like endosymbiont of Proechinophthirus fluctus]|uniref:hypothetical protein n=1 Tax=Sodalis-like endosymbiont of Proechinophthirus fluctus TaxID=1462730 RepID=UPI0007A7DB73|nr:hypothetical protein [Sodalis-like endosymbiont of Proechinophthirus fluctus]KYP97447.1 hypothetical protein BG74_02705 [Sodalis-like endosymbiont of Proechinophthirus fluctus]
MAVDTGKSGKVSGHKLKGRRQTDVIITRRHLGNSQAGGRRHQNQISIAACGSNSIGAWSEIDRPPIVA